MLGSQGFPLSLVLVLFPFSTRRALAQAAPPLIVFGDSLSDQGNRAQQFENANFTFPAFYYKSSRWSNGPVWLDYLDESVTDTTDPSVEKRVVANYAFGSAEACSRGSPADENDGVEPHPKLSDQIQTFLSGRPPLRLRASGPSSGPWDDLGGSGPIDFAIIIGGNDFFARLLALQDPSFDDVVDILSDFEDDVVQCVRSGVEQLLAGLPQGQQSTLMVAGLVGVAGVPALSEGLVKQGLGLIIEEAREDYNEKLPDALRRVSVPNNKTIYYLDLFAIEGDAKERAKNEEAPLQPVEQLEGRCLQTNFPSDKENPTSNVDPNNLDACNDHFFYDKGHPTGPIHHFFGQQIAATIANPQISKYASTAHGVKECFSLFALLLSIGFACLMVGV